MRASPDVFQTQFGQEWFITNAGVYFHNFYFRSKMVMLLWGI